MEERAERQERLCQELCGRKISKYNYAVALSVSGFEVLCVAEEYASLATKKMSVAADSPVHSSSSDDFAAILDAELDGNSSDASPDQYDDDDDNDDVAVERVKRHKVEQLERMEEAHETTSYGSSEQNLEASLKNSCSHPGFLRDMCIICGKLIDEGSGVAFGYIHKDLKLGSDEITRLRNADVKNLLQHKKLSLVLDLDHTLLNSTRLDDISADEEYLKGQIDSLQDVSRGSLFQLDMMRMMTKLRPYVRTFLKEASNLFEMYIYTMGEKAYALEMAKLLDPEGLYFNSRVISQSDCTQRHQKGLDVVLGLERAVLILDDTEAVWQKHKDNLILMERYHYFSSSCREFGFNVKSLSENKSDESEPDGALVTILGVLKQVHSRFFDPEHGDDYASRDVRQDAVADGSTPARPEVLKAVRKLVLKDCKIVFSRVFPTNCPADKHHLWKTAEAMGAICATEVDDSITHVVSTDAGTEKSRWAVQEEKFLVHPQWIEAAGYLWQRKPEEKFPVSLN